MKILDRFSVLVKQTEENDDIGTTCNNVVQNLSKKSIFLAHRNLSRKKGLLAENISEIHCDASELAACSNNIPDGKAYGFEKSYNIDVEECSNESNTGNLCNNNTDVSSDTRHKLIQETIPLHICKQSLKDDDSDTSHLSLVNILLKTSSNDDKDCKIDHESNESNLPVDGLTSLSLDISKESLNSQSATSANYSDATNDTKISLNILDNNNKNSLENDENELPSSSKHVICKEMSTSQDAGRASLCHDSVSISKPFKLPILEKMPKTASVQQSEIEENAVALLDSSFTRQNQLERIRCLDSEPRSSNSSEESNSDIELQHASISNNDIKKVNKLHILIFSQAIIIDDKISIIKI